VGYQKDREEFIARFMSEFSDKPYADRAAAVRAFLRDASAEQRWNEVSCSFDIGEKETARQEKRSDARNARAKERAVKFGAELDTQGDPRGWAYCLLIGPEKRRLGIPGRGLPASAFR
jgi:hypothetical protein